MNYERGTPVVGGRVYYIGADFPDMYNKVLEVITIDRNHIIAEDVPGQLRICSTSDDFIDGETSGYFVQGLLVHPANYAGLIINKYLIQSPGSKFESRDCECGSAKLNLGGHSHWCPAAVRE